MNYAPRFSSFIAPLMVAIALFVCALPIPSVDAAVKIVRLVNDEPITSLDINKRAKFNSVTQRKKMGPALRSQALEELTDEVLKRQEARRLGVTADPARVDQAFAGVATRVKMQPSQLIKAFRQVGVDANTLKRRIEADILWQQVVQQRFRREVRIRDQDIQQAINAKDEEQDKKTTEFNLQQIILILPKGANKGKIAARKKEAEQIRARFTGCADIRASIEGHRDVVYKRIGRKIVGEIHPELRQGLLDTPAGKMSPPTVEPSAIQMFAVCDRAEVEDDRAERNEVRSELMNEQGKILARRLLIDLKQSAVIEDR